MKNEIKTIYKARYVIDIEFTNEPMPQMTDDDLKRMVNIKLESSLRDFSTEKYKEEQEELNHKFDYVENHFPEAILFLYFQMLWLETLSLHFNSLDAKKIVRKSAINSAKKRAARHARERMKLPKGRTPEKQRHLLYKEREKFIKMFLEELKQKQKENEKITKTKIAESLYGRYENPLRELRKRLELYGISFDELVKKN